MSSNILWKGFNRCFSKLKCFPTAALPPPCAISNDHSDGGRHSSKSLTSTSSTATVTAAECFSSASDDDSDTDCLPDFASAFASHRFFCSSPGSSKSILEPPPPAAAVAGGVAVPTYSPDPYSDFRESMIEMIQSRDSDGANWEFLHELLLCYLTLNPKHTHKLIVAAFADVIMSLTSAAPPPRDDCRKIDLQLNL